MYVKEILILKNNNMKKRCLKTILMAILSIFAITAQAETYTGSCGDNLTWTLNSTTGVLKITGTGEVTRDFMAWYELSSLIKSIEISEGATSIDEYAFTSMQSLTSVTIPNSVTTIGEDAFGYCTSLNSVTIGTGLKEIGNGAFAECTSLTTITLPEGVTSIDEWAFGSSGLTSVTIPKSVSSIGMGAFYGCEGLKSISVVSGNSYYSSSNGVLFNKNKTELHTCPAGKQGSYSIPNSVITIGEGAFAGCSAITSVTIPTSVTTISVAAFAESAITSVTIPNSVTTIGEEAFLACPYITTVTIPKSVTSIGELTFEACESLTSINVASSNPNYSSEDGVLFNKNKTELLTYPAGKQGDAYTIPDGVITIASSSFEQCSGLTSVTIPNSVTTIGSYAFLGCESLNSVTIGKGVREIGSSAFESCYSLTEIYSLNPTPPTAPAYILGLGDPYSNSNYSIPLYVPAGSKSAYQSAEGWSMFANIIELNTEDGDDDNEGDDDSSNTDLEGEKIIINSSDNSSKEYGVGNIVNIKFSADDNLILSTLKAEEKYSLSEISSITAESEGNSSLVLNSDYGYTTEFDLSEIAEIEFGYAIPSIDQALFTVTTEEIKLAPNAVREFEVYISSGEYPDSELYPFSIEILKDGEPSNDLVVEYQSLEYRSGYELSLTAGSQKGEYTCRIILGSYVKDIPVSVDYGVYLSHGQIDPENLNEGIGLLSYKTMLPEESNKMDYSFYCYLDGATPAQVANIKQQILNKENYKFENLSMAIGDITIDESASVWKVNVPLTVESNEYQAGTVTLSIEDKDLVLDLTIDDGKHFSELYVSFEPIYTYSEETKLNSRTLDYAYFSYVGGENTEAGLGDVIKMVVYYTMTPDDRGDFIDWKVNVPEDAPVRYIGKQKINTQRFEFDFEVIGAGKSTIDITVENPKADDPKLTSDEKAMYEEYRTQTLSALVDVKDRAEVEVEEVMFLKDESSDSDVITEDETYLKVYNLYSYVTPEESAGAWPAVYSVECFDGAEAEATQITYSEELKSDILGYVTVKHAGKIVVTATAKDKTATLTLTAKMKINQLAPGEKLTLKQNNKGDYASGETDVIIPTLKTDYNVYNREYTWSSNNTDVVEVDAEGNITAKADGTAIITAKITDDFGYAATANIEITVRTVNASVNFDAPEYADHLVMKIAGEETGKYYVDTEETSAVYTLYMDKDITENGVYTVGTDITGTIEFPSLDRFDLVGGTITISGEEWTFDLQISDGDVSGTVTGTKPYVLYEE